MITNREVFEDEFLPSELNHRDGETDVLIQAFEPAMQSEPPGEVLIHGPSGVGKTALARYVLQKLELEADVDHAFVRCLGKSTGDVLRAILDDLGGDPSPTAPVTNLVDDVRTRTDGPLIVVLDEADGLPDIEVLEHLVSIDHLAAVPICHDADDWLARTDDGVRDRFAGQELWLDRYGVAELANILEERARLGLRQGSYDRQDLEAIADEVAGVARFGIKALQAAAEIADEREHQKIRQPDIRDSFERAQRRIRAANLDSLPLHHHVIYELIRLGEPIDGPTLHEQYDAVADEVYHGTDLAPIGQRARRKKLEKLREYDLIEYDGDTLDRHYWVADATLAARIDIPEVPSTRS